MIRHALCLLAGALGAIAAQPQPLLRAHAHNDYVHARPLFDALDQGFGNIEADVYLVDGQLLVAHERKDLKPERTLAALYLDPLRARVRENGGRVFRGGPTITLLVDIKTEARATYAALDARLCDYADMLTVFRDGRAEARAVTVIVSGNRATPEIAAQRERFVAIDGRAADLETNPPAALVPWISENWDKHFAWKWDGAMPADVSEKLAQWVARAHAQGRQVRFWNTPDRPDAWRALLAAGVDLIGTDHLAELAELLRTVGASGAGGVHDRMQGPVTDEARVAGDAAGEWRVMSFNVRYSRGQDGEDVWPKRTALFFATIARFAPDLIGFQEVLEDQHDAIEERMPGYGFCGVARDDGKRRGEWSLVGYRKARFTPIADGTFWLSEQPEVPGSKSWDAALTRICSWVRLRETATGREFVFANTHFDHKGVIARQEASRVLSEQLAKIAAGVPALLTGDLNINEDNPAYQVLVQPKTGGAIRWIDAYREVRPERRGDEVSFHAFKGGVTGSRIDFIFHTEHFLATAADIDRSKSEAGRFPSDHYPVTARLRWK